MMETNTDTMQSAASNLGEKAAKVNIALKYTDGNMDLAKKMANGDLKDVTIIKGRMKSDGSREYGLFAVFVSHVHLHPKNVILCMSRNPYLYEESTRRPWKEFIKKIRDLGNDKDYDDKLTQRCQDFLMRNLDPGKVARIAKLSDQNNLNEILEVIHEIFKRELALTQSVMSVDIEKTNSIAVEEAGVSDRYIAESSVSGGEDSMKRSAVPPEIQTIINNAVVGAAVLSPARGKPLTSLRIGERIKVQITDTSERGRNLVRILQSSNPDDKLKSIPARIRYIKKMDSGNWLILADLGGETYIKINEDTDDVRIALAVSSAATNTNLSTSSFQLPLTISIVVVATITLVTILYFLLF